MRASLLALLFAMIPACSGAQAPAGMAHLSVTRPPATALRSYPQITPPAMYRALLDSAVACTGTAAPRDFNTIVWLQAPGRAFRVPGGESKMPAIGLFQGGGGQDTIVVAADWATTSWVVKHELIHFLKGQHREDPVEDAAIWGEQCHATWGYLQ